MAGQALSSGLWMLWVAKANVIICQILSVLLAFGREGILSVEIVVKVISLLLRLSGIAFFLYAAFQGVFGIGGSTSVFTGVGVLVLVIAGTHVIDRIGRIR